MKKSQVINGVTVTDTFHEAFLHDPDSVERTAVNVRNDLNYRAATDHPDPAYRAEPGDLKSAQRNYAGHGYDPQGYPQGWTGPRTVGTDWTPRNYTERRAELLAEQAQNDRRPRARIRRTRRTR